MERWADRDREQRQKHPFSAIHPQVIHFRRPTLQVTNLEVTAATGHRLPHKFTKRIGFSREPKRWLEISGERKENVVPRAT
jgi:hypothetical protein